AAVSARAWRVTSWAASRSGSQRSVPAGRARMSAIVAKRRKATRAAGHAPLLAGVLESLGAEVVRALAAPRGLEVEIAQPVIHDRLEPQRLGPGDLVLAVGVDPDGSEALDLVDRAAAQGVPAVVVKGTAAPRLVRRCEEA